MDSNYHMKDQGSNHKPQIAKYWDIGSIKWLNNISWLIRMENIGEAKDNSQIFQIFVGYWNLSMQGV